MEYLLRVPLEAGSEEALVFEVDRDEVSEDLVLASPEPGKVADRARVTLEEALGKLKPSLDKIIRLLKELSPDETVVEFGLKMGGEDPRRQHSEISHVAESLRGLLSEFFCHLPRSAAYIFRETFVHWSYPSSADWILTHNRHNFVDGGAILRSYPARLSSWPSRAAQARPPARDHGESTDCSSGPRTASQGPSVLLICNGSALWYQARPCSAGPYYCTQRPL